METLTALLTGASIVLGLIALGCGGVVAGPACSPGRHAPRPARTPVMLVESDVHGGVRGILP
jgi:hypothetical protein